MGKRPIGTYVIVKPSGPPLQEEGQPIRHVYVIAEGILRVTLRNNHDAHKPPIPCDALCRHDIIGDEIFDDMSEGLARYTVRAEHGQRLTAVYRYTPEEFLAFAERFPREFLQMIARTKRRAVHEWNALRSTMSSMSGSGTRTREPHPSEKLDELREHVRRLETDLRSARRLDGIALDLALEAAGRGDDMDEKELAVVADNARKNRLVLDLIEGIKPFRVQHPSIERLIHDVYKRLGLVEPTITETLLRRTEPPPPNTANENTDETPTRPAVPARVRLANRRS